MARDNLLTYPDINETFKIHTDTTVFQLGEFIRHKANGSISTVENLLMTKLRYKVTEKELLSTVENSKGV